MSANHSRYVVAYDIPDDKRRLKVANLLEGYGERIQYSLFECLLTDRQFATLWKQLEQLLLPREDRLRVYQLCPLCSRRTRTIGEVVSVTIPEVYIV